jgi:hypothetical protein
MNEAFVSFCIVSGRYPFGLGVDGLDGGLDRVDLGFVEIDFAALLAYKCGDLVKNKVVAFAVDVKRCSAAFHLAFAVHTFHNSMPSIRRRNFRTEMSGSCEKLTNLTAHLIEFSAINLGGYVNDDRRVDGK